MATKICPICGTSSNQSKFEGNYCIDCFRINRSDEAKAKRRRRNKSGNLLEETCILASELGMTYAQYQIKETCNILRSKYRSL